MTRDSLRAWTGGVCYGRLGSACEAWFDRARASALLAATTSHGQASCHGIWDARRAKFTQCALPMVAAAPLVLVVLLYLAAAARPLLRYRPLWLQPFVREPADVKPERVANARRHRAFYWMFLVLAAATCGVLQLFASAAASWDVWSVLPAIAYALTALWTALVRPNVSNYLLLAVFTAFLAVQLITLRDKSPITRSEQLLTGLEAALSGLGVLLLLGMPLRPPELSTDGIGSGSQQPSSEKRSPEDNLRLWQYLTVSWMTPLIKRARAKQLNDEDVWYLPWEFQHTRLHMHFRELRGTVLRRLLRANAIDLFLTTIFASVEAAAELVSPVLLQQLLASMQDPHSPGSAAITYAVLIFLARVIGAFANVLDLWVARRCYERSRGEMIMMLFEKTLSRKIVSIDPSTLADEKANGNNGATNGHANGHAKSDPPKRKSTAYKLFKGIVNMLRKPLNEEAPKEDKNDIAGTGKILNLMRGDVYEVSQRFWEASNMVVKPIALVVSILLTCQIIGRSALLGASVIIAALFINGFLIRYAQYLQKHLRHATDDMLNVSSQFVESIRHLRWYGWQLSWLDKIMAARQVQLMYMIWTNIIWTGVWFFNSYGGELFPVVAFYAYTELAGMPLRIDIAFPALEIFDILEETLRDIPNLFIVMLKAYVAMDRIEKFMDEPNKAETESLADANGTTHSQPELRGASFAWPGRTEPVLENITAKFGPGLTIICGKVGAGKSALLQALLGELDKTEGVLVQPDEMVAYCAQTPWLQSMSIRDNILFGYPFDEARYKEVLSACQLTTDLAMFKSGDLSAIGENGIGLSGGQRARVALARAVYSRAKIVFLDDPVSALDHDTAESLVQQCFAGPLMEGRTVILVTHRVDLCKYIAKQIIEIDDGKATLLDHTAADFAPPAAVQSKPGSTSNRPTDGDEEAAVPDKFIEDEKRAEGGVKMSVFWQYIKAGKIYWWIMVVISYVAHRLATVAQNWYLKEWGEAYDRPKAVVDPGGHLHTSGLFGDLPNPEVNIRPWLWGFFILATIQGGLMIILEGFSMVATFMAARGLFAQVMQKVAHATFRFYDVTPVGRLMNRLTSDTAVTDGDISIHLQNVLWGLIAWVSSLVVIGSVTPIFLGFAVCITLVFAWTYNKFLSPSQNLRRLEMVSLSPLMSNFGALVEGLTTVRAFRAQARFQERVIQVVDSFQKMDHFYWSLQAWLLFRFEVLGSSSNLILTLLALWTGVSPGLTAFALVAASKFTSATNTLCRSYGMLQLEFVSVERVVELLYLEQEPQGDIEPPATWPSYTGDIEFENVTIRYAPHLPPALENVSIKIGGGSSTALLGRTGSGKSTLAMSILATMVPEQGRILIDGIDICRVDKQALRGRITFLAQDPVLFPGTLRHNLDPTEEHSDEDCQAVLDKVASEHGWKLDFVVDNGGKNLSQGQRQLIGLARVVLRRSPIVILDEATASIDEKTAAKVQDILRDEMKESTVITIAHRLEAVQNATYCVVLEEAKVKEQGEAQEMLKGRR